MAGVTRYGMPGKIMQPGIVYERQKISLPANRLQGGETHLGVTLGVGLGNPPP